MIHQEVLVVRVQLKRTLEVVRVQSIVVGGANSDHRPRMRIAEFALVVAMIVGAERAQSEINTPRITSE